KQNRRPRRNRRRNRTCWHGCSPGWPLCSAAPHRNRTPAPRAAMQPTVHGIATSAPVAAATTGAAIGATVVGAARTVASGKPMAARTAVAASKRDNGTTGATISSRAPGTRPATTLVAVTALVVTALVVTALVVTMVAVVAAAIVAAVAVVGAAA